MLFTPAPDGVATRWQVVWDEEDLVGVAPGPSWRSRRAEAGEASDSDQEELQREQGADAITRLGNDQNYLVSQHGKPNTPP